ncbi:MAG: hypothetical protein PHQ60_08230 [Sideroxydans sp.]|nr:hypothetical protein [Sideroxydans sp.]
MEGLEISEISLLRMLDDNPTFRADAEFFKKEALSIPRFAKALGGAAIIKSGTTPIDRDDELKEGIVLLKTTDIRNSILASEDGAEYYRISPKIADRMKETKLCARDVLINIVGATTDVVGRVAFVPDDFPESNITQAMALLRIHDAEIKPAVLFVFLAGKYGGLQVRRLARPTGQYNLNLQEVAALRMPIFTTRFADAVTRCVLSLHVLISQCSNRHRQAEQTLLGVLGLESWQSPVPLPYTRRASEAFAAERLDADYFEPKYDEMIDEMAKHGTCVNLGTLLDVCRRGKQPVYAESGLPVINSKHVLKNEVRLNEDNAFAVVIDNALTIENGDVLINGTGVGTIGRAAAYLHAESALPDNHVTILRPRSGAIDPIYLSVYLNTIAGQWQVEKYLRGSSGQIELYPSDIAQFKICLVSDAIQKKIRGLIEGAFTARRHAHALLDVAKRAVEIAIEESEAAALAYLAEVDAKIGVV